MKKNKKYLLAVISGFLGVILMWIISLSGKPSQYDYFLSNHSGTEIIIKYIESNKKKQLVTVETGTTICLFAYNFINHKDSKIKSRFKDIQIYSKLDTSTFDYLNETKWKYEEKDKIGKYKLEITNDDFTY